MSDKYNRLTRRVVDGVQVRNVVYVPSLPFASGADEMAGRLAEYEDIGSPEELRRLKNATTAFEGVAEPSEDTIMFLQDGHQLRQWLKRCAWHCQKVNEQSIEIRRLKAELDALHKPRKTWSDNVDIDERT